MLKLHCTECGYKFSPKKDAIPKICPFCGRSGTIEKERPMQDLLDEVIEDNS